MNIKYSDDNKVLIRATGVEGFFEIPDTVERVESCAFDGCSSLNAIVIPASVDFIGSKVFEGCKDLIDVFCNIFNILCIFIKILPSLSHLNQFINTSLPLI